MANPILQALSGANQQMPNSNNNPLGMIQRFAEFKKQLGNLNPQQIVQELLNSVKAFDAIDELMDVIKVTNERLYNSVMRKIGEIE